MERLEEVEFLLTRRFSMHDCVSSIWFRWKSGIILVFFLCSVLQNDKKRSKCLAKKKADDKLWTNTFEHLSTFHRAVQDEL